MAVNLVPLSSYLSKDEESDVTEFLIELAYLGCEKTKCEVFISVINTLDKKKVNTFKFNRKSLHSRSKSCANWVHQDYLLRMDDGVYRCGLCENVFL